MCIERLALNVIVDVLLKAHRHPIVLLSSISGRQKADHCQKEQKAGNSDFWVCLWHWEPLIATPEESWGRGGRCRTGTSLPGKLWLCWFGRWHLDDCVLPAQCHIASDNMLGGRVRQKWLTPFFMKGTKTSDGFSDFQQDSRSPQLCWNSNLVFFKKGGEGRKMLHAAYI